LGGSKPRKNFLRGKIFGKMAFFGTGRGFLKNFLKFGGIKPFGGFFGDRENSSTNPGEFEMWEKKTFCGGAPFRVLYFWRSVWGRNL